MRWAFNGTDQLGYKRGVGAVHIRPYSSHKKITRVGLLYRAYVLHVTPAITVSRSRLSLFSYFHFKLTSCVVHVGNAVGRCVLFKCR